MSWLYENKEIKSIEDFGKKTPFGFVYITTYIPSGKQYIGKKSLFHNVRKKLSKKALTEYKGPGRKPKSIIEKKESDWKTYYGSELRIKKLIKEGKQKEFKREILYLAPNKKLLTYEETKLQFELEVLKHPDKWYNTNILGSFFTKDFE